MSTPNQRYHDRVAGRYDDIYARDLYWQYYLDVSWQDLKRSLPRDLSHPVLDVGCGTGLYGLKLMKSGFNVVFSDWSHKMVDVARRKAAELFPNREAEFTHADITDLAPFDDASFSLVVGQGDPLSFSSDWRLALKNLSRVLIDGGRAVMSVDNRFGSIDPFQKRNDIDGLVSYLEDGNSSWLADRKEERFPLHAFTPEEFERAAPRVGLQVVRVIGKTIFDLRGEHIWLGNPESRKKLLALEKRYGSTAMAIGRAHHIQVTLEKRSEEEASSTDDKELAAGRPKHRKSSRGRKRGKRK